MDSANAETKLMAAESTAVLDGRERKWEPGIIARFPLVGLGALLSSILCTAVAIGIVLTSNGKPASEWSSNLQPSVLLAYTSTLANALLAVAFAEAVVISYWTRALRGAPMSNLHYNWAGGTGAVGAFTALFHGRALFVSIVCLLVTITSLLRGPLMQKASSLQTETVFRPGKINLQLTYNVSENWAAVTDSRSYDDLSFNPRFSTVVREFQARTPIRVLHNNPGCANCSLSLPAFGFAVDCTKTYTIPYNVSQHSLRSTVFNSTVTASLDGKSHVTVTVSRMTDSKLQGNLTTETCRLKPAIVNYDLVLNNGFIAFQTASWRDDSVVKELIFSHLAVSTTVEALQVFGSALYDSKSICRSETGYLVYYNEGLVANTYLNRMNRSFGDPMDEIVNSFREVSLRMSAAAAEEGLFQGQGKPDVPYSQTVSYMSRLEGALYKAELSNLVLAVIISLLGPVSTFALFWGWWELGRPFSLSPIEVVNAFHQPTGDAVHTSTRVYAMSIFTGCNGNATAGEIVKHLQQSGSDDPLVYYGIVDGTNRLCMVLANDGMVAKPGIGDEL